VIDLSLEGFHPAIPAWFRERLGDPTALQIRGWPAIRAGGAPFPQEMARLSELLPSSRFDRASSRW
jgi:hypothetical protein